MTTTPSCGYGGCTTPAEWQVFAVYPDSWDPTVLRRQPLPHTRPCRHHLAAVMERDRRAAGGAGAWYVLPLQPDPEPLTPRARYATEAERSPWEPPCPCLRHPDCEVCCLGVHG